MLVQFKQEWFLHQWLVGHLQSSACLFVGFFFYRELGTTSAAALAGSVECCPLTTFPVALPFGDVSQVLVSLCPHCVFTTKCQAPPTRILLARELLGILERSNYRSFSCYTLWRRKLTFKQGIEFTQRTQCFLGCFPFYAGVVPGLLHLPQ